MLYARGWFTVSFGQAKNHKEGGGSMRSSLIIISFFVAGLLLAYWGVLPEGLADGDLSMYALYLLMFLVGISIGSDMKALRALKEQHWKILLVPLATILGTLGLPPSSARWAAVRWSACFYRGARCGTAWQSVPVLATILCPRYSSRSIAARSWARWHSWQILSGKSSRCWGLLCWSAGLAGLRQFVRAGRRRWIRRFPLSVAFPERSL